MENKIKTILSGMSLEDKIAICNGADFWHSKAMERYSIPAFTMSDAPLRAAVLSSGGSFPANVAEGMLTLANGHLLKGIRKLAGRA